ncbi:hypothetical protein [Bacillus sp. CGMCC 1.16541]|uniref:helix-turn-helix domain-containing protein n=1 Tax=Bacillus sp. CGMCC 1.16541 TaxID=2185143 RepID=UPI000D72DA50|nr:hypothetical protein [Bacillus sp. CGMCC 1.16541]
MNDEQRNQIRILRYQGVGYMKIGKTLGLSRDIIRNYCKRHGLDGRATELVIIQVVPVTETEVFL